MGLKTTSISLGDFTVCFYEHTPSPVDGRFPWAFSTRVDEGFQILGGGASVFQPGGGMSADANLLLTEMYPSGNDWR